MCALVGSFDKSKLKELFNLNAYRGELSYSLASFNHDVQLQVLMMEAGKMPGNFIDGFPESYYYIGHTQAPTTEATSIHPAAFRNALLWHNGIVKQKELPGDAWDTEWILKGILTDGFEFLSTVDGTFACIMYQDGELFVFRNEISPLFVDDVLNFSSTKFIGSHPIEPNKVFKIDIDNKALVEISAFQTKDNPYYFG